MMSIDVSPSESAAKFVRRRCRRTGMAACLMSVWWFPELGTPAQWGLLGGWLLLYLGISLGTERLARARPEAAV